MFFPLFPQIEELYEAYCLQRRLRDGADKMVKAYTASSSSKEAKECLSEANKGYKEYTEVREQSAAVWLFKGGGLSHNRKYIQVSLKIIIIIIFTLWNDIHAHIVPHLTISIKQIFISRPASSVGLLGKQSFLIIRWMSLQKQQSVSGAGSSQLLYNTNLSINYDETEESLTEKVSELKQIIPYQTEQTQPLRPTESKFLKPPSKFVIFAPVLVLVFFFFVW